MECGIETRNLWMWNVEFETWNVGTWNAGLCNVGIWDLKRKGEGGGGEGGGGRWRGEEGGWLKGRERGAR